MLEKILGIITILIVVVFGIGATVMSLKGRDKDV